MIGLLRTEIGDFPAPTHLNELRGRYPVLHFKDELSSYYDPQKFFAAASEFLQIGGWLLLEEAITGFEDAWLNALASTANPAHIRFHRAEDIIAAAGENFMLTEYQQYEIRRVFQPNSIASLTEQIASFPEHIAKILLPEISKSELSLTVNRGIFLWRFKRA